MHQQKLKNMYANNYSYHQWSIVQLSVTPLSNKHAKLEMIQHRAACFVLNKPWYKSNQIHDSVTEMLAYLKWPSLQNRRKIARLTLLFKIVKIC